MAEASEVLARRTVGVRDIPLAVFAPRRLFARVEDVPGYGIVFLTLLVGFLLVGYAIVQTGLIHREVDRRVNDRIALIDATQRDVVERSVLRTLYEEQQKLGKFEKLLVQMQVIAAAPLGALATTLLLAAVLYGAVALTGRKPEWHTLLTIFIFAGFIDLLQAAVALGLTLHFRTLAVDTSPLPLLGLAPGVAAWTPTWRAVAAGGLAALDPFRLWYWWVVIIGLSATAQLRGWRVWSACGLCWLCAAGGRVGVGLAWATLFSGAKPG